MQFVSVRILILIALQTAVSALQFGHALAVQFNVDSGTVDAHSACIGFIEFEPSAARLVES